jgi:hypothetical protein
VGDCVKCLHGRIIREHVGLDSDMKKTGRVNIIKVYIRNCETSLLILRACFIIPNANFHLNVVSSDKTLGCSLVFKTAELFEKCAKVEHVQALEYTWMKIIRGLVILKGFPYTVPRHVQFTAN